MLGELTTVPGVEDSSGYKKKQFVNKKKKKITAKKEVAKGELKVISFSFNKHYP